MSRPSDAAAAVANLIVELSVMVHKRGYPIKDGNFGASLERMYVAMAALQGTASNNPMSASAIAKHLGMPRQTVGRHLKTLTEHGHLRRIGNVYVVNLDLLDEKITDDGIIRSIDETERALAALRKHARAHRAAVILSKRS